MIAPILAFGLKHWKGGSLAVLFALVVAWGFWQRHEAVRARVATAAVQATLDKRVAADKLAAQAAQAAQAKADAAAARQRAALVAQAASATRALVKANAALRAAQEATKASLGRVYRHSASARAWRDTPIPASIAAAIGGGA